MITVYGARASTITVGCPCVSFAAQDDEDIPVIIVAVVIIRASPQYMSCQPKVRVSSVASGLS
jgi:hypothetical protein